MSIAPAKSGLGPISETNEALSPNDLKCPVCAELLNDPFVTSCGHSFCYNCIQNHISSKKNCPTCCAFLTEDQIHQNFLLKKVLTKAVTMSAASNTSLLDTVRAAVHQDRQLSSKEIEAIIRILAEKNQQLQQQEGFDSLELLLFFLRKVKATQQQKLLEHQQQLNNVTADLSAARARMAARPNTSQLPPDGGGGMPRPTITLRTEGPEPSSRLPAASVGENKVSSSFQVPGLPRVSVGVKRSASMREVMNGEKVHNEVSRARTMTDLSSAKVQGLQGLAPHFGELQNRYLQQRTRLLDAPQCSTNISESVHDGVDGAGPSRGDLTPRSIAAPLSTAREGGVDAGMSMEELSRMLTAAGRFSRARLVTVLRCKSSRTGNVLSSIEFDKEGQLIATAGVMRAINVFNLSSVLSSPSSKHVPCAEMRSRSKLSCLSWSHGQRHQLLSSDYDGTVTLWDTQEVEAVQEWEAHDKHIWSVDFNTVECNQFATGSDDASVKVWSVQQESCCLTIPMAANVCSVQWHPTNGHQLLVGSAAHTAHLYDIRHISEPLKTLTGHQKAVSYARFLSADEVVSASIDSSLRLWNLGTGACSRVFSGHVNEKNFVGLCTEGEFMLSGSETNEVFLYCSSMSKPVLSYSLKEATDPTDVATFVTAVAWRPGTNTILTANSSGNTWILELGR